MEESIGPELGDGDRVRNAMNDDAPLRDTSAEVSCPYCGACVELLLDPAGGSLQTYVEDCEVCCRPWQIRVSWNPDGTAFVEIRTDDE